MTVAPESGSKALTVSSFTQHITFIELFLYTTLKYLLLYFYISCSELLYQLYYIKNYNTNEIEIFTIYENVIVLFAMFHLCYF